MKQIKALANWFHDIKLGAGITTHRVAGVDKRVLSMYRPMRFPEPFAHKLPMAEFRDISILEIRPASGFYSLKFAQANNRVHCIEPTDLFLKQIRFASKLLGVDGQITLQKGKFPDDMPTGRYDLVWCLGVLYHTFDHQEFVERLTSLGAGQIFLEVMFSKDGQMGQHGLKGGIAFSEDYYSDQFIPSIAPYRVEQRIDFDDSDNPIYNSLDFYRSVLCLRT